MFAHIHLAPAGVNGPVVAFLFGPVAAGGGRFSGVLAQGTLTEDDLIGPLAGQEFTALVDAMLAGNSYVNVHTDDGVAPGGTGPGDLPAGEVRGQIRRRRVTQNSRQAVGVAGPVRWCLATRIGP